MVRLVPAVLLSPAAFILSLTWLVFTASPRARSRAYCIGNHTLCVRYTCDMTWDILLVFFWTAMLAVVASGLAAFDDLFAFLTSLNLPGRLKSSWGLSSDTTLETGVTTIPQALQTTLHTLPSQRPLLSEMMAPREAFQGSAGC